MKHNIGRLSTLFSEFCLRKVEAKYFQVYLSEYLTEIRVRDCELLLEHIIGSKLNREKVFYAFFLSPEQPEQTNPLKNWGLGTEGSQLSALPFFHKSSKVWRYGSDYQSHSKPLYL
jgi:hypothetical protein